MSLLEGSEFLRHPFGLVGIERENGSVVGPGIQEEFLLPTKVSQTYSLVWVLQIPGFAHVLVDMLQAGGIETIGFQGHRAPATESDFDVFLVSLQDGPGIRPGVFTHELELDYGIVLGKA